MALLAALILAVHLVWLALVIFGALWTRGRPVWSALHILALVWGVIVEVSPWPCPLTLAEQYFEGRFGRPLYQGGFLLHYLDAICVSQSPCLAGNECRCGNMRFKSWNLLQAIPKVPWAQTLRY